VPHAEIETLRDILLENTTGRGIVNMGLDDVYAQKKQVRLKDARKMSFGDR
jgi:hypothetical protein